MRAILPGRAQAKLQALCTGLWEGKRIIIYISGNALIILSCRRRLLQTIYLEESEPLDAVTFDEGTGKIATCSGNTVYLYRPYGKDEGALKWYLQHNLDISDHRFGVDLSLSWGSSEELLAGSSSLNLIKTDRTVSTIWYRRLSKPVKIASFSHNAELIASTGVYDRLVKIWRRLSFGSEDTRFDFSYLPHPATVTSIQWRKSTADSKKIDSTLYTICADKHVRIWTASDPHGLHVLQLWAEIDMLASIQPREISSTVQSNDRYAFFVNSEDFALAIEHAVRDDTHKVEKERHASKHLREVAQRNPDVCVVLDRYGHMSAWGLEDVGCKVRKPTNIFNFAHVEDFTFPLLPPGSEEGQNISITTLRDEGFDSTIILLVHGFHGEIAWLEARIDQLFDPLPRRDRVKFKALWTGHDSTIRKIIRTGSGNAVMSHTYGKDGLVWEPRDDGSSPSLERKSVLEFREPVEYSCLVERGRFVANLYQNTIFMWDVRTPTAGQIASCSFKSDGKPLCLISLPKPSQTSEFSYIAMIASDMYGIVWQIEPYAAAEAQRSLGQSLQQFCSFNFADDRNISLISPIESAQTRSTVSSFPDSFRRDSVVTCTTKGTVSVWSADINFAQHSVSWLAEATVETQVKNPSMVCGNSTRNFTIVDTVKTNMAIWNFQGGLYEYTCEYGETIEHLDWLTTPNGHSILAVGFLFRVIILTQLRYDYLNASPAWVAIRELSVKDSTPHPIGDSTWIGNGHFVIGAGNQLFVYDRHHTKTLSFEDLNNCPISDVSTDLFEIVARANTALPIYHPQFISQCILAGKLIFAQGIIIKLHNALKYYNEGDELPFLLDLSSDEIMGSEAASASAPKSGDQTSYLYCPDDDKPTTVSEDIGSSLNEGLTKLPLPHLSSRDQSQLADMIMSLAIVEKHYRSLDAYAMRYLLVFQRQMLGKASGYQVHIGWREIAWAYHSETQDILVDQISRKYGRMLWKDAQESGMFMWMTDLDAVRAQFEVVARNEYTKTNEKNPIDCSIYYLALKKKSVLQGLWRMASWNREQASTQRLLSNNFQESRWKTAALKNAYALMGKRRFEYAAAFFLLAGNLQDAVNICFHQMQNLQLAIAVARVYDGDSSSVLRNLIDDKILPQALREGNRWLASWAYWMLGRQGTAALILISRIQTPLDASDGQTRHSKSYLNSEPALLVLYGDLRRRVKLPTSGAFRVEPREEWNAIMQTTRLYLRMGCALLALDLVRNWKFAAPSTTPATHTDKEVAQPRMLPRRTSSSMSSPKSPTKFKSGRYGFTSPKAFEEPSASSLLDNFGL